MIEQIDIIIGRAQIEVSVGEVCWLTEVLRSSKELGDGNAAAVVIEHVLDGGDSTSLNRSETEAILLALESVAPPSETLRRIRDALRRQFALADEVASDDV